MAKIMCWEYMKCNRENDRSCPAVVEMAGRSCWLVAGTMCGGEIQGEAAQKMASCRDCDFYKKIKAREI